MTREERVELIEKLCINRRSKFSRPTKYSTCTHGRRSLQLEVKCYYDKGKRDWSLAFLKTANGDKFIINEKGNLLEAITKQGKKLDTDELFEQAKYARRIDNTLKILEKWR